MISVPNKPWVNPKGVITVPPVFSVMWVAPLFITTSPPLPRVEIDVAVNPVTLMVSP